MKNHLIVSLIFSSFIYAGQSQDIPVEVVKNEVCETQKCEADMKKSIQDIVYFYVAGSTTLVPLNLEAGIGAEVFENMEVEAYVAQDLVNFYGDRPYNTALGARARYLWGKKDRRYFVEIEGANYFMEQDTADAFDYEIGAFFGKELSKGQRASIGLRRITELEGQELAQKDIYIPTIRLQFKFGGKR